MRQWLRVGFCLTHMKPAAAQAYQSLDTEEAVAPFLLWFEIRSVLLINERKGRIAPVVVGRALSLLSALPLRLDQETGN